MGVRSFEHIGIVVDDLERVADFFELLGFERAEPFHVRGRWADRVNGLDGTDGDMVFVTAPDGSGAIELTRFRAPLDDTLREGDAPANRHGLRHLAYRVDELAPLLERLAAAGYRLVREAVNYEDLWLVCYVRGPEGLIIELGERLDGG